MRKTRHLQTSLFLTIYRLTGGAWPAA